MAFSSIWAKLFRYLVSHIRKYVCYFSLQLRYNFNSKLSSGNTLNINSATYRYIGYIKLQYLYGEKISVFRAYPLIWFDYWFNGFPADVTKKLKWGGFATFRYTHHLTASFAIDTRNTFIFFTIFVQNVNDFCRCLEENE